jgi:hypothetical protein
MPAKERARRKAARKSRRWVEKATALTHYTRGNVFRGCCKGSSGTLIDCWLPKLSRSRWKNLNVSDRICPVSTARMARAIEVLTLCSHVGSTMPMRRGNGRSSGINDRPISGNSA